MKILSISKINFILLLVCTFTITAILTSCTVSQKITAKSGAQLWAENCQRCHNTPSPSTFNNDEWETVGMHMQTRSMITEEEKNKIVGFLKQ